MLATVANVLSDIYSHVSGKPTEKIGNGDMETTVPNPLKKSNSAGNFAKILKRNFTKQNLLASISDGENKQPKNESSNMRDVQMDTDHKTQQKRSLATVTEEAQQNISDASISADFTLTNGELSTDLPLSPVLVSISQASEENDTVELKVNGCHEAITSTPDKEPSSLLPNPHIAHLLCQPRDSFEMEEVRFTLP